MFIEETQTEETQPEETTGDIEKTDEDLDAIATFVEENFDPANTQTTNDANAAITNAGIANTAETFEEASAAENNATSAKNALDAATDNSSKAAEALKAAQAKADELTAAVADKAADAEDLEGIKNQYYAMLIQYYREGMVFLIRLCLH